MREICTSGLMSGRWKRSMAGLVRHRQTKEPVTDRPRLNHRATSRLYSVDGQCHRAISPPAANDAIIPIKRMAWWGSIRVSENGSFVDVPRKRLRFWDRDEVRRPKLRSPQRECPSTILPNGLTWKMVGGARTALDPFWRVLRGAHGVASPRISLIQLGSFPPTSTGLAAPTIRLSVSTILPSLLPRSAH